MNHHVAPQRPKATIPRAAFAGLRGQTIRTLIDAAIAQRKTAAPAGEAMTAADLELVKAIWPHLHSFAELLCIAKPEDLAYVAPVWQVNPPVRGEPVVLQTYRGDRHDEALVLSGNFESREQAIEVAQAIAEALNERSLLRARSSLLESRVAVTESELASRHESYSPSACASSNLVWPFRVNTED